MILVAVASELLRHTLERANIGDASDLQGRTPKLKVLYACIGVLISLDEMLRYERPGSFSEAHRGMHER